MPTPVKKRGVERRPTAHGMGQGARLRRKQADAAGASAPAEHVQRAPDVRQAWELPPPPPPVSTAFAQGIGEDVARTGHPPARGLEHPYDEAAYPSTWVPEYPYAAPEHHAWVPEHPYTAPKYPYMAPKYPYTAPKYPYDRREDASALQARLEDAEARIAVERAARLDAERMLREGDYRDQQHPAPADWPRAKGLPKGDRARHEQSRAAEEWWERPTRKGHLKGKGSEKPLKGHEAMGAKEGSRAELAPTDARARAEGTRPDEEQAQDRLARICEEFVAKAAGKGRGVAGFGRLGAREVGKAQETEATRTENGKVRSADPEARGLAGKNWPSQK